MCAALHARGVATSRLLLLRPTMTGSPGADLIITSVSIRNPLGSRISDDHTPVLIASFGSGDSLINVHATSPGGAAVYNSALRADLAARRTAGAQLLRSRRIEVSTQDVGHLEAGQVDSRLLVTLAVLASLRPLRVIAFDDASPGTPVPSAQVPFRQVTIAVADGRGGPTGLAAALAMVRAQRAPYQPAHVTIVDLAAGQAGLRIDFAAPSPLGLLTGGGSG